MREIQTWCNWCGEERTSLGMIDFKTGERVPMCQYCRADYENAYGQIAEDYIQVL